MDKHAPLINVRNKPQTLKWISGDIRALMRSRNYYMHKFQKTKDPSDWEQYHSLRNKVKKELRNAKKEFLEELCSNLGNEPRKVWGELNKTLDRNAKTQISHIQIGSQTITSHSLHCISNSIQ